MTSAPFGGHFYLLFKYLHKMQTPHIPNEISFSDLQGYLKDAPSNENDSHSDETISAYEERIVRQADDVIKETLEIPNLDPMVHKIMVLKLMSGFGNYLYGLAERTEDSDEREMLLMRIGKLSVAHNTLVEIPLHERDFTADNSLLSEENSD